MKEIELSEKIGQLRHDKKIFDKNLYIENIYKISQVVKEKAKLISTDTIRSLNFNSTSMTREEALCTIKWFENINIELLITDWEIYNKFYMINRLPTISFLLLKKRYKEQAKLIDFIEDNLKNLRRMCQLVNKIDYSLDWLNDYELNKIEDMG